MSIPSLYEQAGLPEQASFYDEGGTEVDTVAGARNKKIRVIRDWREAIRVIDPDEEVSLDLETGGLNPWRDPLAVIGLCGTKTKQPAVLHVRGRVPEELRQWLGRPGARWITHNGPGFDLPFMACNGVDVFAGTWYCTMLGEQVAVVTNRRNVRVNLARTAERRTGKKLKKDIDHSGWMKPELNQEDIEYCVGDIMLLGDIKAAQVKKLAEEGRLGALEVEQALSRVTTRMVLNGLPLDMAAFKAWRSSQVVRIADADRQLHEMMGPTANIGSPVQVLKYIQANFDPDFKSTNKEYMLEYCDDALEDDPLRMFLEDVILWRQGTKRSGMYDDEWVDQYLGPDGRIHARFWQVGTDTGRFSSSGPNLQQWPRDGRGVIGGEDDHLIVAADYDAIEVVVAAILARDEALLEDCRTGDPHMALACFMNGGVDPSQISSEARRLAKAGNFTLLFCGGVNRFHQAATRGGAKITLDQARRYVDMYLARYRGIERMRQAAFAKSRSMHVRLDFPTGLRRDLGGSEIRPTIIVNNLVQGTAAAGLKFALLECERRGLTKYIGATVHDEIVANVPRGIAKDYENELVECMIEGMNEAFRRVRVWREGLPITVGPKVGTHWK